MECEAKEYEALYDETDPLADYRFYKKHGGEEANLRNVARFLEAVSFPGDGLILSAPEQVGFLSHYYRDQLSYYPLPEGPTVGEATKAQVRGIMMGHDRVHALFWGAEERDPHSLIEDWLGQYGHKITERHFDNLRLALYTSEEHTLATARYLDGVYLGESIELAAYRLSEDALESDRTLRLTLYWQTLAQMDQDYTVFTHLINNNNRIWAQHDSQPQDGQYPTSQWIEGEVIVDEHELTLADDIPPGEYQIEVGMYDWASGERLQVSENGQRVPENRVIFETMRLRDNS
jgi:hypothetical protein